jgi:hypothetical protein
MAEDPYFTKKSCGTLFLTWMDLASVSSRVLRTTQNFEAIQELKKQEDMIVDALRSNVSKPRDVVEDECKENH